MKKVLLLIFILVSPIVYALDEDQSNAAYSWLEMIDARQFEESWALTSSQFQDKISSTQWTQALSQARTPLGALESRKLKTSTQTNTLPGAPEGEYVVITFSSAFANKDNSIETLTLEKEDNVWRPVGYFIR